MAYNFKSEEDVKEYLTNLGIEYRFGCYKEKNPEVCHLLGDYLEAIKKDYEKAVKIYKNNCDAFNFPKSCVKYGNYLATGKGMPKPDHEKILFQGVVDYDPGSQYCHRDSSRNIYNSNKFLLPSAKRKALSYYEKGCELGEINACYRAGVLNVLESGSNKPARDYAQGIQYFEKSCNAGHSEACYHLSGIYMDGIEKANILKDMKKSYDFALKACELNHIYACANVCVMYKKGDGVPVDLKLSEKYKTKALELQKEINQQQQIKFQEGLPAS